MNDIKAVELKREDDTLITKMGNGRDAILRGTFVSPRGSALHVRCAVHADESQNNYGCILLHAPEQSGESFSPMEIMPELKGGLALIKQDYPDDALHAALLSSRKVRMMGDKLHEDNTGEAFKTSNALFTRLLLKNDSDELLEKLKLDKNTVLAASEFYRKIMRNREFVGYPDEVMTQIINDKRSERELG